MRLLLKTSSIFLSLCCCLLVCNKPSFAIETKTLERDDGSIITYYLERRNDPKTLLLVLQGSDCNSVAHNKSIKSHFSQVLPNADLLLIEKRGITKALPPLNNEDRKDCPQQYLKFDNPTQRVHDIKTVLSSLLEKSDYQKIVVVGGSEGATIAYLAAREIDYIAATIAFNGGGQWFYDDIIHSMSSSITDKKELDNTIKGFTGFSDKIKNSKPFSVVVSGHGYEWWRQMLSIDLLEVTSEIKSPLLILQGGADKAVSPEQVKNNISALKRLSKENITYIEYPGLDHGFKNSNGDSQLDSIVIDMTNWLKTNLTVSNAPLSKDFN